MVTSPVAPEELAELPRRAVVAFAARCARRMQPFRASEPDPGERYYREVDRAILVAEEFARRKAVAPAVARAASDAAEDAARWADSYDVRACVATWIARVASRIAAAVADRALDGAVPAAEAALCAVACERDAAAAILADFRKLLGLGLGRRGTLGAAIEPAEHGPLGPLWPRGAPYWFPTPISIVPDELEALPRRALVALAARCARRVRPLAQLGDPKLQEAVDRATQVAEEFARGPDITRQDPPAAAASARSALESAARPDFERIRRHASSWDLRAAMYAALAAWHACDAADVEMARLRGVTALAVDAEDFHPDAVKSRVSASFAAYFVRRAARTSDDSAPAPRAADRCAAALTAARIAVDRAAFIVNCAASPQPATLLRLQAAYEDALALVRTLEEGGPAGIADDPAHVAHGDRNDVRAEVEAAEAIRGDFRKLLALEPGDRGTIGKPVDPTEQGPLGPLWPRGEPPWLREAIASAGSPGPRAAAGARPPGRRAADEADWTTLPPRARMAIAARCACRVQPFFRSSSQEELQAIEFAIRDIEGFAAGRPLTQAEVLVAYGVVFRAAADLVLGAQGSDTVVVDAAWVADVALRVAIGSRGMTKVVVDVIDHAGHEAADAALGDMHRLRDLGFARDSRPGEPGRIDAAIDPTEQGPLGPLWPRGEPAWFRGGRSHRTTRPE